MAKIKYTNKVTGQTFTGDSKEIDILKKNPILSSAYTFEAEEEKPKEVKTTNSQIGQAHSDKKD